MNVKNHHTKTIDNRDSKIYDVNLYNALDIVERINEYYSIEGGFVVNIGAGFGNESYDPCFPFFERGYAGLAIEGRDDTGLDKTLPAKNIIKLAGCYITPYNAAELLSKNGTPIDLCFLKIDIDGYDSCILKSILNAGFRPKVIQLEINPEIPFPIEFSVMYDQEYRVTRPSPYDFTIELQTGFYGMSFAYAARMAKEFQYHIVCIDNITTHDIILVDDRLHKAIGSNTSMTYSELHKIYFSHPFPEHSHFREIGSAPPINAYNWRYNTDYDALCREIWIACVRASMFKHDGGIMPFYFATALRDW